MRTKILCLFLLLMSGCGPPRWWNISFGESPPSNEIGGEGRVLHLPFPEGDAALCAQGAGGGYSHHTNSTMYDLDFDTPNNADVALFAPIDGVARVHLESAAKNFGYHVNIDQGDGTYVVVAHLKEVFVSDGDEVAAGTLLGIEGCTGLCTGDHVHIGLHRGDASETAEYGTSIPAIYALRDATLNETDSHLISGDDVVCDVDGSGHTYVSSLATALWHPNGLLVKPFASPKTSLVEGGELHWIVDESAFFSRGYAFSEMALISNEEQDCFSEGSVIEGESAVRAVVDAPTGQVWLVSGGMRQRVPDFYAEEVLTSWGIDFVVDVPALPPSDVFFSTYPVQSGFVGLRDGTAVKEEATPDLYLIADGIAMPVETWETYLLMGLFGKQVQIVPDGAIEALQNGQVGDCRTGHFCIDREAVTTCGGGLEAGDGDWGGPIDGVGTFETDLPDSEPEADSEPEPGPEETDPGCLDWDQDGFCSRADGGDDCFDRDATTYPGAPEICGNRIDEDCDGADLGCGPQHTDTDGDGVMDANDNCILFDNGDQSDIDQDAIGDACDTPTEPPPPPPPADTDVPVDTGSPPAPGGVAVFGETLSVTWTTPFGFQAARITLSGEYIFHDGSYGFTWRPLQTVSSVNAIHEEIPWVLPGDTFRFSVEYVDQGGTTSWSCIGPFPPGVREGRAEAYVAGTPVPIRETGDPSGLTTGCGLILTVP